MEQVAGTVDCWFNGEKGYGFIRPEGGDEAVFVHHTGVAAGPTEAGFLSRGDRVISDEVCKTMRKILSEIQDGSFAREWILENQAGCPVLKRKRVIESETAIEKVGLRLRKNMPFVNPKEPPK